MSDDEVYIVYDEATEERFVFTDVEEARDANNIGHWSRRALYPALLDPDADEWGGDDG